MPKVNILEDQETLVPTEQYPEYAKFPFENFNPVQSRIFEVYNKEENCIIAAATSAGKTICAEMFMAQEVRERGGKAMYLAPLRALAKEKIDDWTDDSHHFSDVNLSICTGDYQLTPKRRKELEESDVILMTSEMLNSRCRNYESENNQWLTEVGTLVVDESHLLTVPGRGDHLEVGLMKFCEAAPNARIVFLSATMPNVDEIAEWVSKKLTGRDTNLINSTYRPCPLGIHWTEYDDSNWKYDAKEEEKIYTTLKIVDEHPDDRFLLFVHTKKTGNKLLQALKKKKIEAEFHSADLEKDKRHKVEHKFRSGSLRVIVATSTLAWGLNMPARRVVITGIHRGLSEVETYDIWQMAGRAGRPGYDPRGDVYILLPAKTFHDQKRRLESHTEIESQLLEYVGKAENPHFKILAFHLVSEIHHNNINTKEDVHRWYNKSLANYQANDLDDSILDRTLELLLKCGAIRVDENEEYQVTAVGRIASMFYYSPFDVSDLKRNFNKMFERDLQDNDVAVSIALGAVDSNKMGFCSKAEKEEMGSYAGKVKAMYGNLFDEPAIKGGYAYFLAMNGLNSPVFSAFSRNLQFDYMRTSSVLKALDSMSGKWEEKDFWETLEGRVVNGVPTHLVQLCKIPNIGKVRAEKLWAAGFHNPGDMVGRDDHVKRVLNMKDDKVEEIMKSARGLDLMKGFG
jgi:replicative superfamily II helicase